MYYINMNTNSSNSSLLNRAVDAHGGLERWREVRYLDVRLSVSGGLFQIKGHPEGLHDVFMRIPTQRACRHHCSLRASRLSRPLYPHPACGSKTVSVVSSRNVPTPVRRSPDMSSR